MHLTHQPTADTRPLSGWHIAAARLTRRSAAADTLDITLPRPDPLAPHPWGIGDTFTLTDDDGTIHFRGTLTAPTVALHPADESLHLTLSNIWADLDRLTYTQIRDTYTGPQRTPNIRLAAGPTTSLLLIDDALATLAQYASAAGLPLTLHTATALKCPAIDTHNHTVGDILRQILRWVPDATVIATYSPDGQTHLTLHRRSDLPDHLHTLQDTTALTLSPRPDLQIDGVTITYHIQLPRLATDPGGDLQLLTDTYIHTDTVGTPYGPRTLVLSLDAPVDTTPDTPAVTNNQQPIVTRPLPRPGATDADARQWWIDHSGLAAYGITQAQVRLPTTTVGPIRAHTLTLDPTDTTYPPSVTNPASRPLHKDLTISDLPRELVEGTIADYMSVAYARVIASATIAIPQTTVDALPPDDRAALLARTGTQTHPVPTTTGDVPCHLLHDTRTILATDAITKVYKQLTTYTGTTDPTAHNSAAIARALADHTIPDLPATLYAAYSPLYHDGTLTITTDRSTGHHYWGHTLSLAIPSRPDLATLRAHIATVTDDFFTGTTTLTLSPPGLLTGDDFAELQQAARADTERKRSAHSSGLTWSGLDSQRRDSPPPTVGPLAIPVNTTSPSGAQSSTELPWDITTRTSSGTLQAKITHPGKILKSIGDLSESMAISGLDNWFSVAERSMLILTIEGTPANPSARLECVTTWTGYPCAVIAGQDNEVAYRYPLWIWETRGNALEPRRLAPPSDFLRTATAYQVSAEDPPVISHFLTPYHAAI